MEDPVGVGGTLGDYALKAGRERPLVDVLKDIFGNVQEMMRSEVRLVRVELREEAAEAARAGAIIAVGGAMGMLGTAFLLLCVTQLLYRVMPDWAATLLVGSTLSIVGAVFVAKGRAALRVPTPDRAMENVKENVEWMKNQTK